MDKVRDYVILESSDSENLMDKVKRGVTDGWQPLGGVAATIHPVSAKTMFIQAMVKPW